MSSDRGSLSLEYVIIAPFVFLLLGLVYAFGRVAAVDSALDADTRDAARAASLAPDRAAALAAANRAYADKIGNGTSTCATTLDVTLDGAFAPGSTITVNASCQYQLSDVLDLPSFAGGTITVRSQFSVLIDPNRSLG